MDCRFASISGCYSICSVARTGGLLAFFEGERGKKKKKKGGNWQRNSPWRFESSRFVRARHVVARPPYWIPLKGGRKKEKERKRGIVYLYDSRCPSNTLLCITSNTQGAKVEALGGGEKEGKGEEKKRETEQVPLIVPIHKHL